MEIPLPFLKAPIGAGDVAKAATSAAGITPCTPCQERARLMNRALTFVPREQWTSPPHVPDGWKAELSRHEGEHGVILFHHEASRRYMIWEITGGRYRNSQGFCCETMREVAVAHWEAVRL